MTYTSSIGYRALDVDYEQGKDRRRYEHNVLRHVPLVGPTVGF